MATRVVAPPYWADLEQAAIRAGLLLIMDTADRLEPRGGGVGAYRALASEVHAAWQAGDLEEAAAERLLQRIYHELMSGMSGG